MNEVVYKKKAVGHAACSLPRTAQVSPVGLLLF